MRAMEPHLLQSDPQHRLIQPNALHQYNVTEADVPLSCPMPGMFLWNSHPKVYLAIEQTGWAKCAYCGAEYTLDAAPAGPSPAETLVLLV